MMHSSGNENILQNKHLHMYMIRFESFLSVVVFFFLARVRQHCNRQLTERFFFFFLVNFHVTCWEKTKRIINKDVVLTAFVFIRTRL